MADSATTPQTQLEPRTTPPTGQAAPPLPVVPNFDVIKMIGQGTFGTVWLAKELVTGVYRAIKTFPKTARDTEITGLCEYQRRVLNHPHLLPIHLVGQTDTNYYVVMELADDIKGHMALDPQYYEPASLDRVLRDRGPMVPAEAVTRLRGIVAGVDFLHRQGLVHRDIKPSNVLLVGGAVKLCDFGLVAPGHRAVERAGTHGYWRPDGPTDRDSDLYATAKVAFQLFTGNDVSQFPELPAELARISSPELFGSVRELLDRGCAAQPARRFSSSQAMLEHVERMVDKLPGRGDQRQIRGATVILISMLMAAIGWAGWLSLSRPGTPFAPLPRFKVDLFPDGLGNPNPLVENDPSGLLADNLTTISTAFANPMVPREPARYARLQLTAQETSYMLAFWIAPDGNVSTASPNQAVRRYAYPELNAFLKLDGQGGNYVICAFFDDRPFRDPAGLREAIQELAWSISVQKLPPGTMRILREEDALPLLIGDENILASIEEDDLGLLHAIRVQYGGTYPMLGIELPLSPPRFNGPIMPAVPPIE